MTTKRLSEKTEQNPSEPQPHWSNNILGSPSLSNPFWSISVRGHSHIQASRRNVQWTFMGGYLNYMYVFVCGDCLAKTYCFLPSIGQLAMAKLFSAKYMFAMVSTKKCRKNLKKSYIFRPQLVKSLVIVIYFFKTKMRDAANINYWLLLYSYSKRKNGCQIIGLTLIS